MVAASAVAPYGQALGLAQEALARGAHPGLRQPNTLPDPSRPAGTPTGAFPFDHVVVVMMENHSFDNYLGMLPRRGQPLADGFTFDAAGRPTNSNPVKGGYITIKHADSDCTPNGGGSQTWSDTHKQIDRGRMDGFALTGEPSMVYWDEPDLPFYYSMAKTFCLANRWFASCPAQTYPNRRFLLAATAFGLLTTDTAQITENPPNGTIVDRLNAHNISWTDYFSDVPATGVIESIPQDNPTHLAPLAQFYNDCRTATLPAVSFVDSDIGAAHEVGGRLPPPFGPDNLLNNQDQDEEYGDLSLGENFVSGVVDAVLHSPLWPRILLVWTYDEHGGWYDHVPVPRAIAPDSIQPRLAPGDPRGGYDIYGVRVPAAVVSGHARPRSVTNVVHDHTSILATIQAKWNLPAMTLRDANAATLADFLSPRVTFPEPPTLSGPSNIARTEAACDTKAPTFTVHPYPRPAPPVHVLLTASLAHDHRSVIARLHTSTGTLRRLSVQLVHRRRVISSAALSSVGPHVRAAHLRAPGGRRLAPGHYTVVVRHGKRVLASRGLVCPDRSAASQRSISDDESAGL